MRPVPPYLVKMSSKGQMTIPVKLRQSLRITPGTKVAIHLGGQGEFIATVHRRSRIMDFAGDLKVVGTTLRRSRKEGR